MLHELIRLYNAKVMDCQYCQNARQAVAVQAGLREDMVARAEQLRVQRSAGENQGGPAPDGGDLQQSRPASRMSCGRTPPRTSRNRARRHRAAVGAHDGEQGDDHARPGPRKGSQLPAVLPDRGRLRQLAGTAEAIEELRRQGVAVQAPSDEAIPIGAEHAIRQTAGA